MNTVSIIILVHVIIIDVVITIIVIIIIIFISITNRLDSNTQCRKESTPYSPANSRPLGETPY